MCALSTFNCYGLWPPLYTDPTRRRRIREGLLRWYARDGRELPWRRTRDPYAVLVSEIMLQQTQVSRVLEAYPRFLQRFPTLAALARASLGDVLRAWSGLGYNRRARDLWRTARSGPGVVPSTRPGLDALPGIGRYTAGAVACFAFDLAEPFADTNVGRVLGRLVLGHPASANVAEAIDGELLPRRRAARWHHALMDFGATVCLARAPRCDRCPLARSCVANARGTATVAAAPKRQAAFATSDRRVRGAILRALAPSQDGLTVGALGAAVGDGRVSRLVGDLLADGLVERGGRRVRLPR